MKWFEYRQNNSGGSFVQNDSVGIHVFIEAESAAWANQKALTVGIYFDGCSTGADCSCCGDRWNQAYDSDHEDDHMDEPKLYDYDAEKMVPVPREGGETVFKRYSIRSSGSIHMYHADGTHETVRFEDNKVSNVTKE